MSQSRGVMRTVLEVCATLQSSSLEGTRLSIAVSPLWHARSLFELSAAPTRGISPSTVQLEL